ncbi:uncharacterized protein LOC121644147 [Melanotaenia boesemani]|uniref:uncharacterized protein LOC121644147 n=1 Tax=Melanotaenia boesemani TaxID=1250792 RepID=UPI001C05CDAD|nr:uncharacterized protein LOC121644147 [Melanotaenia boesemani]
MLERQHNVKSPEKVLHIDTYGMTSVWNGKVPRFRWDPSKYQLLFGVVNEHHHWFLVVIYPSQNKTLLLDPLGETAAKLKRCQDASRALMRRKGIHVSRWKCDTVPHPHQPDSTSCGVFAIVFAEKILYNQPVTFPASPKDVSDLWWQIATTLLRDSDDLTNLCLHCGEASVDGSPEEQLTWISCDACGRWFHHDCVGQPKMEEPFKCTAC